MISDDSDEPCLQRDLCVDPRVRVGGARGLHRHRAVRLRRRPLQRNQARENGNVQVYTNFFLQGTGDKGYIHKTYCVAWSNLLNLHLKFTWPFLHQSRSRFAGHDGAVPPDGEEGRLRDQQQHRAHRDQRGEAQQPRVRRGKGATFREWNDFLKIFASAASPWDASGYLLTIIIVWQVARLIWRLWTSCMEELQRYIYIYIYIYVSGLHIK